MQITVDILSNKKYSSRFSRWSYPVQRHAAFLKHEYH